MDWFDDRWLTLESAELDSQGLIDQVSARVRERESNRYGEVSGAWAQAAYNLRRDWFRVSIGLADGPGEQKETFFLSEAKGIGNISEAGPIVPFTHWLGSLYAQLREAALQGKYPAQLEYGPPGRVGIHPVGPLVEYRIENGRIRECKYHSSDAPAPIVPKTSRVEEPATARSSLRPIWLTIDPEQDSNFRWPFHGIYVLSGGPGTGKTSLALLRIRFLIEQQQDRSMASLLPDGMSSLGRDFFTEQDMLVVVWERHLEPYLRESLVESRFGDVPVRYYDDWLNDCLRDVVPIGAYKIDDKDAHLEAVKRTFTEKQLGDWMATWDESARGLPHPLAAQAYQRLLDFIGGVRETHKLSAASDRVAETWEVLPTAVERARFRYSMSGIDAAIDRVKAELVNLAGNCVLVEPVRKVSATARARYGESPETPSERVLRREGVREAIPAHLEQLDQLHRELADEFLNRYPQLLLVFYDWETDRWLRDSLLSSSERDEFLRKARDKIQRKRLSKTDRVLILWLIQLVVERTRRENKEPDESLPDYSHIMVDEAQQYDPMVLRLFCRLARPPFHSVTLVGDLRQRLREDGGVVMWDDLGLALPEERRARLLVNYRWAQATFRALKRLSEALKLADIELKEPVFWPAGTGVPAVYQVLADVDEELEWVVDRINDHRSRRGAERWSIAVLYRRRSRTDFSGWVESLPTIAAVSSQSCSR